MNNKEITYVLHHYKEEDLPFGAVSPPIFQTSIFSFKSFHDFSRALNDETNNYLYTRGNNPTVNILEEKIAALEQGEKAKFFASGVAAIASSVLAFVRSGDHIISVKDCYSWTQTLFERYLSRFGIETTFVEGTNVDEIEDMIKPNTKIIYLESPTTFTFKLQNLRQIAVVAKKQGIRTIVDNSWATPYFQQPINMGIDLVVHSASKYLGGHSDLVAGVVIGKRKEIEHIFKTEFLNIGAVIDPFTAWLILRGLRTLHIRMQRHFESTMKVTKYLSSHPKVERVIYPFLNSHPQFELAKRQMSGGSGLFSIKLITGNINRISKFVDKLRYFKKAVSWGGYESLVFPYVISHPDAPKDLRSLVRLHIGLEEPEMLIKDLENALKDL
ncbi:MAG: cystathionine beta-lyase [Thermotoga sp.]|nr:MAG: cystathionine beta-lyase [Thermotoga sp.]